MSAGKPDVGPRAPEPGEPHPGEPRPDHAPPAGPEVLAAVEQVLRSRLVSAPEGSYSVSLLRDPVLATRKIMEEAYEVSLELTRAAPDSERVASEAADLIFHLLAGIVGSGTELEDVWRQLQHRRRRRR
jgi:phosphoribosyl-ATP pyrophosphohydrolase